MAAASSSDAPQPAALASRGAPQPASEASEFGSNAEEFGSLEDSAPVEQLRRVLILEHLRWLVLKEDRCEWILGVLRCLAVDGTATDGASAAGAAAREGGLRRFSLPGASQSAETETKKRRVVSGGCSRRRRPGCSRRGRPAHNDVKQRETEQRRRQLLHGIAEARARHIEGQRLSRYREWLRTSGASQPGGKVQEVAPFTQKELEVLEKYDNGELLKERHASIVALGDGLLQNGSGECLDTASWDMPAGTRALHSWDTGGGSRRLVDSWKPPDWREFQEDPE